MLVVSVGLEPHRGYWGEVLTTGAEARGIVGLVIDGGVRDVDALEAHGFPVFSAMIALRGATKEEPGRIGGQTLVGDVEVERGDWIVGDADGVVVVRKHHLDAVLAAGQARAEKEAHMFEELKAGRTTVQLLGLDDVAHRTRLNTAKSVDAVERVVVGVRDLAADGVVVQRGLVVRPALGVDRHVARVRLRAGLLGEVLVRQDAVDLVAHRRREVELGVGGRAMPPARTVEPRGTMKQRMISPVAAS